MKIPFDPSSATAVDTVRQVIFERLRQERGGWSQLDLTGDGFQSYAVLDGPNARRALLFHSQQIYVELLAQGLIAPGSDASNTKLPSFHITSYGASVLDALPANPYFPPKYLLQLKEQLPGADATVLAYMNESLETFARGNHIAATVILGIAAERVFLLLCDSLAAAIQDMAEKKKFQQVLDRRAMKPKLDWVNQKFQAIHGLGFPDNAAIMVTTVYDLLRFQRNELGHPRETPPSISRPDAFVNLQVFPRYYVVAEQVRSFWPQILSDSGSGRHILAFAETASASLRQRRRPKIAGRRLPPLAVRCSLASRRLRKLIGARRTILWADRPSRPGTL